MLKSCRTLLYAVLVLTAGAATAQPKIYLVRHAEKLENWPGGELGRFQPLSEQGRDTARRLAHFFAKGTVQAIFSSATTRTLHTAFPLSQKLGVPIEIAAACSDTAQIAAFYRELAARYGPEETVLLVSHSNIIPYLLIRAGLPDGCHTAMGFSTSPRHSWLLTDFYGELFFIRNDTRPAKTCADFQRIPF